MSDRLTNGRLLGLSVIRTMSARHVDHETLTDVRAMAEELIERRSRDLSAEDVEALRWIAGQVRAIQFERATLDVSDAHTGRALATLDKLLNR